MSTHSLQLFADYHQFYLWDAGAGRKAPESFSDEDLRLRVSVAPNVVVIHPVRNSTVPVLLEIRGTEPTFESSACDHAVDCSLELPTGSLEVHESTGGPVLTLDVMPGTYRVRALFSGLATLSEDHLDGSDMYRVVVWPAPPGPRLGLKQWGPSLVP